MTTKRRKREFVKNIEVRRTKPEKVYTEEQIADAFNKYCDSHRCPYTSNYSAPRCEFEKCYGGFVIIRKRDGDSANVSATSINPRYMEHHGFTFREDVSTFLRINGYLK